VERVPMDGVREWCMAVSSGKLVDYHPLVHPCISCLV
jgi:hypothetical protein